MIKVKELIQTLSVQWKSSVINSIDLEIDSKLKSIDRLKNLHRDFLDEPVFFENNQSKRNLVFDKLKQELKLFSEECKANSFSDELISSWDAVLSELDEQIEVTQPEERFVKQDEDSLFVIIGKHVKQIDRSISKSANTLSNHIKRLLKQDEQPILPKVQVIPVRLISANFTQPALIDFLVLLRLETNKIFTESVRQIHQSINLHKSLKGQELVAKGQELLNSVSEYSADYETKLESLKSTFQEKTDILFQTLEHDLTLAGSFENPITIHHTNIGKRASQNYVTDYEKKIKPWIKEWDAQLEYITQIKELEKVNSAILKRFNSLILDLDDSLNATYPNIWKSLASQIERLNKRIESHVAGQSKKKILKDLLNGVKASTELLKTKIFPTLESNLVREKLDSKIDAYDSFFDEQIEKLSTKAIVITELEKNAFPPKLETKPIEWQSLINRILIDDHIRFMPDISHKIAAYLMQAAETLRSIEEIIEVNLTASHDSMLNDSSSDEDLEDENSTGTVESTVDNAIETASSALERVSMLIAQVISQFEEQKDSLWEQYKTQLNDVILYLESKLHGNELADLEFRRRELQVRSTALDFQTRIQIIWAQTEDLLLLYGRFAKLKIKEIYSKVKNVLFPESSNDKKASQLLLGEYLKTLSSKLRSLPFIYQKLFSLQQNADLRHFTGYEQELNQFQLTFQAWSQELIRTTIIVGETGSGKNLVVDKALEKLDVKLPIIRISLKKTVINELELLSLFNQQLEIETNSFEELTQQLKKLPKRIIVFDSLDKSFLRIVSGFGALNELLLLVNNTAAQVFWVVSIGRYAWNYLDKVNQLSKFFTDEIQTDQLGLSDIKDILIKRHRSSGFQLRFEPDTDIKQLRAYKKVMGKEDERQKYLEALFFEKLYEVSLGNSKIAIIQWLRSIQEFNTFEMVVLVESDLQIELPQEIDRTEFFALAFILQHQSLSISELAKAFHQSEKQTALLLSRLEMMNLVEEKSGLYTVNIFAYRPVVKALTTRNILYN